MEIEKLYEWTFYPGLQRLYIGEEINIQAYVGNQICINNHFADKLFIHYFETNRIIYQDGKNILTNKRPERRCELTAPIFPLEKPGDSVNLDNGGIGCMLEEGDLRELLENTFFLPGQLRFYDFINQELLLLKW
ncbi:hypothetical protein ACM39_11645 [Chryseobacterium sp. FH2]|uniref:hypothetical protein n=1 Tax=Chryseobacterium sp. FH2 TaxID=1674291 RepID=UPI00065AB307|nr:hypothetical protein [Chryseobacterium sp. FH2]KMQ67978.1 hypothetical protein ACM39_11645 [Chryseobacterium sp. FH2]